MNNFDFSLFPKIYFGGCSRKKIWLEEPFSLFTFTSHVCGSSWSGSCSGCGETSASWVEHDNSPWALAAAALVQLKTRKGSVEMDHSSSLADEKGRNLANCNAFINAKLYRDAESKPSPAVKQHGPKLYHRALWKLHNPVTHTHTNPLCLQYVIWCFMEELISPLGDQE